MAPGELLESDLAAETEFIGTNGRLPPDERAQIDPREMLSASWAQGRMRDVAHRYRRPYGPRSPRVNRLTGARPNGGRGRVAQHEAPKTTGMFSLGDRST